MNRGTYRKLWAILGAGVLTLGVVGVAMAIELKEAHQGITVSWDENGTPVIGGGFPNSTDCDEPGEGEVIFHFVQSGQGFVPNSAGNNLLDVDFEDEADSNGNVEDSLHENNVDWFVSVDASDGSVTLVTANSNLDGGELRVSHICVGDAPEQETAPPTAPPTEAPTETPFQSVFDETDAPTETPFQSVEGDTDEPSEPDTATIGTPKNVGSPADGAWLLVVALGVLLASIVVLTPARANAPRR